MYLSSNNRAKSLSRCIAVDVVTDIVHKFKFKAKHQGGTYQKWYKPIYIRENAIRLASSGSVKRPTPRSLTARHRKKVTLQDEQAYMLFAGWELQVRIVKNCDRGLEIAARDRPQFFTLWTEPEPANNFLFSCDKLANKWVYATFSLNWLTGRLQTIVKTM